MPMGGHGFVVRSIVVNGPGRILFSLLGVAMAGLPEMHAGPNIVVVLADDLGYADVGVYGSQIIRTPHIDALAARGVRFTEGYVSHPVCSPSRAGMMTGRYQQRFGWEFNPAGRDQQFGMAEREKTLGDRMQGVGYRTGLVGKWHLGVQDQHNPIHRGFSEYFGVREGGTTYFHEPIADMENAGRPPHPRLNQIVRGTEPVVVREYLTDAFTREAVSFIERASTPFFLFVSHITPHTPLQATRAYTKRYRHIEDPASRIYAAMVASLDDSVGDITAALRTRELLDDTLFVFLSDNGCAGYIGNACSNAPLRGFKRYHHEGGVRVPFLMSWPDVIPKESVYTEPVSSLDLLDTFLAAAGHEEASSDSTNLLPYVTGVARDRPHEALYWRSGSTTAIRKGPWKLVRFPISRRSVDELDEAKRITPPEEGWNTNAPHGLATFLYNVTEDIAERNNLTDAYPDIVAELLSDLDRWRATLREPVYPPIRSTLATMHGETVQLLF